MSGDGGSGPDQEPKLDKGTETGNSPSLPKSATAGLAQKPSGGGNSELQEKKERDQTGRKNARDYPFGEDPLGDKENNEVPNKSTHPLKHNFRKNSVLNLEKLDNFLNTKSNIKAELIKENQELNKKQHKSCLDETNIIDE